MTWETKKLDEICNIDYGTRVVKSRIVSGDFDVYGGGGKTFTLNEYNRENCTIISRFAISKNCVRTVSGKFFLNDSGLSVSTKDSTLLSQDFLDKFLFASEGLIYSLGRGQAQRNLHIDAFREIQIPLPPLEEQKKIVAILDEKFAKLREAKRLREEAIADTEKILSTTLREIFEEGKKKGWEKKAIGEIASLMTGATPSTSRPEYYGGNIKWLVSGDIHNKEIFDCEGRINELGVKNSNAKLLPKNSLLIALNGQGKTKGTVSILRTEATCNQSLVAIIPSENVLVEYLYYCLNFQYKNIRGMAGDDSRKGLNMKLVREIQFLLPPLTEQKQIVAHLDALSEKLRTLRELQKSQLDDMQKLEKAYLREAFAGELKEHK